MGHAPVCFAVGQLVLDTEFTADPPDPPINRCHNGDKEHSLPPHFHVHALHQNHSHEVMEVPTL